MAGAVYWVGANGNIYLKSSAGVQSLGSAQGTGALVAAPGSTMKLGGTTATRIADPNPPRQTNTGNTYTAPSGGGGGSVAAAPVLPDKSNDIALQLAGLSAVDQQFNTGISTIDRSLGNIIGGYDAEATANTTDYQRSVDQNQNNLQKNRQTALVNAAQGRAGLTGTLASLGALNGSGLVLRDRAVQKGANDDLAGADNTFGTNQSALDTSINTFKRQDEQRRKDANVAAQNAKLTVENNAAQNRLQAYKELANDYSEMGNGGEAARYTALASQLFPTLARTSVPNIPLTAQAAAYTPASLASYIAGTNPTTVAVAPAAGVGQTPGLVATSALRKKQLQTV